ncbi:MAG: STAS domain-containing protein [Proteobacteria bacterium]|nr:STAS domain-containing protein [Pseudomonadota bacterium]
MIKCKKDDDKLVCVPEIDMVASNVSTMRDVLVKQLDSHDWEELVVDCNEVETLDSIGVNLIVGLYKKAESANKSFKMIGCNGSIIKVLKLFRLGEKFTVES